MEHRSQLELCDGWAAALKGNLARLTELVSQESFDVDAFHPVSGMTALHLACMQGHEKVVGFLLRKGADVNCKDVLLKETALHKASAGGHARIVQMLLTVGADMVSANRYGVRPKEMAIKRGHKDVLTLLTLKPSDRALEHGNSLVAQALRESERVENQAEVDGDDELKYLALIRRAEKQAHMAARSLKHERRKSVSHQECFEEAIEIISTREIQLEQLTKYTSDLENDLSHERERADKLEHQLQNQRKFLREREKLALEVQKLERQVHVEVDKRKEADRALSREKDSVDKNGKLAQDKIFRLQGRIADLEVEREESMRKLRLELEEERFKTAELKLQVNRLSGPFDSHSSGVNYPHSGRHQHHHHHHSSPRGLSPRSHGSGG